MLIVNRSFNRNTITCSLIFDLARSATVGPRNTEAVHWMTLDGASHGDQDGVGRPHEVRGLEDASAHCGKDNWVFLFDDIPAIIRTHLYPYYNHHKIDLLTARTFHKCLCSLQRHAGNKLHASPQSGKAHARACPSSGSVGWVGQPGIRGVSPPLPGTWTWW